MAKKERSQEDILTTAAEFVANTITPVPTELIHEQFVKYFKEKASEILATKGSLLISVGPCINTDNNGGIYSNDMQVILEYVEGKMQAQFSFLNGALIWICQDDIYSVFLPH